MTQRNQEAFEFALKQGVLTDNAGDFNYQGNYRYAGKMRLFDGETAIHCYVFQHLVNFRKIIRLAIPENVAA